MSCGTGRVDHRCLVSGASTCAVPVKIGEPEPLFASQLNVILLVRSSFEVTATFTRIRSPTRMRWLKDRETFVSVQPGPGMFMLKRPEISDAHHMLGPFGGSPP